MKKVVFLFVLALGFAWDCHAQTWTYVQDSIITYCGSGSSCGNFGGTMIPTLSNSVWVFYIDTASATSASVSGGGATWTECVACRISITNHHAFVFYAFGGTAGSTNFTVSTPGNSGSLSVNFLEFLPPSGATASFDASATATPTCGGAPATCVGAGLTVSGTDFVYEFLDGTANPTWNNWPSPWLEIHTANAAVINATGTIAAPTVTVRPGFSGTAVFTAIAFKSSLGSFTPPAPGPLSMVQFADPDPLHALNGLNCAPSCTLNLPASTGSGHLLYLEAANTSGVFLSAVTGGGTWTVPASCQIKGGQAAGNALSCAYALSSSSGATSVSITMAGTANTQFAFYEAASASGSFAFDTAATATNAASFHPSGASLSLAQGFADIVFQSIFVFGGTSSVSYFPYLRSCSSGCGLQFWNGEAASNAVLNVNASTIQTPQFANQQNNATVVSGVAFKVGTGSVTPPNPPSGLTAVVN